MPFQFSLCQSRTSRTIRKQRVCVEQATERSSRRRSHQAQQLRLSRGLPQARTLPHRPPPTYLLTTRRFHLLRLRFIVSARMTYSTYRSPQSRAGNQRSLPWIRVGFWNIRWRASLSRWQDSRRRRFRFFYDNESKSSKTLR
jgi:hypothetical protein